MKESIEERKDNGLKWEPTKVTDSLRKPKRRNSKKKDRI
jgi:hypothetical protein